MPNLGIRLVSAYDSTGTLGNVYASAASTPGDIVPYNNSSGNWRFGNLTFSAGIDHDHHVTANPPGSQILGQQRHLYRHGDAGRRHPVPQRHGRLL